MDYAEKVLEAVSGVLSETADTAQLVVDGRDTFGQTPFAHGEATTGTRGIRLTFLPILTTIISSEISQ